MHNKVIGDTETFVSPVIPDQLSNDKKHSVMWCFTRRCVDIIIEIMLIKVYMERQKHRIMFALSVSGI